MHTDKSRGEKLVLGNNTEGEATPPASLPWKRIMIQMSRKHRKIWKTPKTGVLSSKYGLKHLSQLMLGVEKSARP